MHSLAVYLLELVGATGVLARRTQTIGQSAGARPPHSPADIRDIDHIPLPILQSRSGQVLKVDRLLLELLLALREGVRRGNAPAVLANLGKVRGREELLKKVAASLASGANDEGGFGGHGEEDEGKVQDTDSVLVMVSP